MDTDKIIDMVWDNLLEPLPKQFGDSFRTLTCGCIVWRDGEYLDLYQYRNNIGPCDAGYAHEVALAARAAADGDDAQGERMTAAVAGYTDGWDEEGETLREMFRAAISTESVVH